MEKGIDIHNYDRLLAKPFLPITLLRPICVQMWLSTL